MGLWQWLRGSRGPGRRSPGGHHPPRREGGPARVPGWSQVGPVQRTTSAQALLSASAPFEQRLVTRQNPALLRPLGHSLTSSAPSGLIRGLLQPAGDPRPTLGRPSAASPASRTSSVRVQRYYRPGQPGSLVVADAPAQPRPLPPAPPLAQRHEVDAEGGLEGEPTGHEEPASEADETAAVEAPPLPEGPGASTSQAATASSDDVAVTVPSRVQATSTTQADAGPAGSARPAVAEDAGTLLPTLGAEPILDSPHVPSEPTRGTAAGRASHAHALGLGAPLHSVPTSSTPPVQRSVDTAALLRAITSPGAGSARARRHESRLPPRSDTSTGPGPLAASGAPSVLQTSRTAAVSRPAAGSARSLGSGTTEVPRRPVVPEGSTSGPASMGPNPSAGTGAAAAWPPRPLATAGPEQPHVPLASARGLGIVQRSMPAGRPGIALGLTDSIWSQTGGSQRTWSGARPSPEHGRLPARTLPSPTASRLVAGQGSPGPSVQTPAGTLSATDPSGPPGPVVQASQLPGVLLEAGSRADVPAPTDLMLAELHLAWPSWDLSARSAVERPEAEPAGGRSSTVGPVVSSALGHAARPATAAAVQRAMVNAASTRSPMVPSSTTQAVVRPATSDVATLQRVGPRSLAYGRATPPTTSLVAPAVSVSRLPVRGATGTPIRVVPDASPPATAGPTFVDAGQVAVDLGLASRQGDGSVVFAPASPSAAGMRVVQRSPDTQAPTAEAETTRPQAQDTQDEEASATTATTPPPGSAGVAGGDLDELAARLYPRLSRQLRLELVRERDRLGSVVDVWH